MSERPTHSLSSLQTLFFNPSLSLPLSLLLVSIKWKEAVEEEREKKRIEWDIFVDPVVLILVDQKKFITE